MLYLGDGSWGRAPRAQGAGEAAVPGGHELAYHLSLHRLEGEQRFHLALDETGGSWTCA